MFIYLLFIELALVLHQVDGLIGGKISDTDERHDRTLIAGGVLGEDENLHNFVAAVSKIDDDGTRFCSGFLLTRNIVVTTAACLVNQTANRVLPIVGCAKVDDCEHTGSTTKEIIFHPKFSTETFGFNIAYIILEKEVSEDLVPPIYATPNFDLPSIDDEFTFSVSGFGSTFPGAPFTDLELNVAQTLERVPFEACFSADFRASDPTLKTMMCTGRSDSVGVCPGDGGGPLFLQCPDPSKKVVIGNIAGLFDCSNSTLPIVYTRLNHPEVFSFTLEVVAEHGGGFPLLQADSISDACRGSPAGAIVGSLFAIALVSVIGVIIYQRRRATTIVVDQIGIATPKEESQFALQQALKDLRVSDPPKIASFSRRSYEPNISHHSFDEQYVEMQITSDVQMQMTTGSKEHDKKKRHNRHNQNYFV